MTGAFSYHHPKTEKRGAEGKGVGTFATGAIAAGEVLVTTGGRVLPFSSLLSHELPGHPFQIEKDLVLAPFDPSRLDGIFVINHSCEPNAGLRGQTSLVALRAISPGEEICYDYVMTDSDPAGVETFSMSCLCGAPGCRKRISDVDWRDAGLRKRYRGHFSSYLQHRIDTEKQ